MRYSLRRYKLHRTMQEAVNTIFDTHNVQLKDEKERGAEERKEHC